ncbi:MAG: Cytochrome c biosis protein Ccs1 [Planctomycetota bacterium]
MTKPTTRSAKNRAAKNEATQNEATPATKDVDRPWFKQGIVGWTFDLFSSVKFGIWLLVLLFIYSSIGSAGVVYLDFDAGTWNIFDPANWAHDQLRQWRGLEMTEFEWFHWWPFDLMMILIAINITVTTLRRIPFKAVNYGVWMIHTGIIVLIVGSFIYFGTKVEGDTPVARRQVIATYEDVAADGTKSTREVSFLAAPGTRATSGEGADQVTFEVTTIDPEWELLTGDDKGKRAYSVTVAVTRGEKRYMRQLLVGYPQLTEDLIFTDDPQQPMKRSVKETGNPIFDASMAMRLDYEPQGYFYLRNELVKSWALYVRKPGDREWVERKIDGLPLYNDYIGDRDLVFQQGGDKQLPLDPLDVAVGPTSENDPFQDVEFRINGFLRYAIPRSRFVDGPAGSPLNPVAFVTVASDRGQRQDYRLVARDPDRASADGGLLRFVSIDNETQFAQFTRQPTITIRIPSKGIEIREEIRDVAAANPDAPFVEIKGTEEAGKAAYAYRVSNVRDDVPVGGATVSLAILEVRTPKGLFRRWVFSDPSLTRDVVQPDASDAHGAPKMQDDSIETFYEPGNGLALVSLVHGPEEGRIRLVSSIGSDAKVVELKPRETAPLAGGITVRVEELMPRAILEAKPLVVPREQRERDAMEIFSQILVSAPNTPAEWLEFNRWVFNGPEDVLRRSPYKPMVMRLADGREVELLFSRQRLPLGTDIALEEFILTSHVGGFTGAMSTIRDYTSAVRFRDPGSSWSEPTTVSVNDPIEHDGLWYFQAQWDPPDTSSDEGIRPSAGLNYTVLGVGNRNGVYIQLLGCVIAVAGMIYAFYVKPVIKRRRQEEVLAGLARNGRKVEA